MNEKWTDCLLQHDRKGEGANVVGVLTGEGIGEEVITCAIESLEAISGSTGSQFDIRYGGVIGRDAEKICGKPLSPEVFRFCDTVFQQRGAILCGPGGGRFVYDLRKQFDLFFKISPIEIANGFPNAARIRTDALRGIDILVTREGSGGVYQGDWHDHRDNKGNRYTSQLVSYNESQVQRFLDASAKLARSRNGELTVVWKQSGVPTISSLWKDCAEKAAAENGVRYKMVDVDLMAYLLIQDSAAFDVIATPNLFGDVLSDLAAVLLGSRGVSYSGNYSECGRAVYQTNHGAAYDLAGSGRANPIGQILSLAMMIRESFGLGVAASAIEHAVRSVRDAGYVTPDLEVVGHKVIGTREMGSRIAKCVEESLKNRTVAET